MHCKFCQNEEANHSSEDHICKKCNKKGLHSYKNCSSSYVRKEVTSEIKPSFLTVASKGLVEPKTRTKATLTTSPSQHFKYNNLFRVLVAMMTESDKKEENTHRSTVHFEHCSTNFMVDFTDEEQTDNFFDKMYTDSKTITEEFVRAFMKKLATFDVKVDLHALHIELFKNFYTVDPSSLDSRYYVTVL